MCGTCHAPAMEELLQSIEFECGTSTEQKFSLAARRGEKLAIKMAKICCWPTERKGGVKELRQQPRFNQWPKNRTLIRKPQTFPALFHLLKMPPPWLSQKIGGNRRAQKGNP